jgi:hypothetical protein
MIKLIGIITILIGCSSTNKNEIPSSNGKKNFKAIRLIDSTKIGIIPIKEEINKMYQQFDEAETIRNKYEPPTLGVENNLSLPQGNTGRVSHQP